MSVSRPISDVFIDTDVMVNVSIGGMSRSDVCRNHMESLLSSGNGLYYSQLLRVEYLQALRNLVTKQQLPRHLYDDFELHRWSEPLVRERWIEAGYGELDRYLTAFSIAIELPLRHEIIAVSRHLMARYALRSLDACHLATALHYEIPVFWTCDDHFQRVDEIAVEIIH